MTYPYHDAYLAKFATTDREGRATQHVATLGTFTDAWTQTLVVLHVYVLACLEHQADAEDLFTAKLKTYRAEFDRALILAKADAAEDAGDIATGGVWSIPMERA